LFDPAQHGAEPLPVQMIFRQKKPVVPRMLHQPSWAPGGGEPQALAMPFD